MADSLRREPSPTPDPVTPELLRRARALASAWTPQRRPLLGIAGPPGAGKSTLATALVDALTAQGTSAVVVGMDGFHLADEELARLGRADRKGAPDTFDAAGYVALLHRLAEPDGRPVACPVFDRSIEASVPDALVVDPDVRLVVTEGNYLLVDDEAWGPVAAALTECWYVGGDEDVRRERLVARHERHGRSPEAARAWALGTDERNARLVAGTRGRADLVVTC